MGLKRKLIKMKKLISILIILSFVACNQKNEKKDILIETFENNLGENETNHLNEIVNDFDKYLAENYPDQESKFRAYLSDINELKVNKYWEIDSTKLERYKDSKLLEKYETGFSDSAWKKQNKLHLAIGSIKQTAPIITSYLTAKKATGNLPLSTLAGGLMYYLRESNEYFAKRIFILELFGQ